MEGLLLSLVGLAPWGFGCVHPGFEALLYAGIAALLMLWGVRVLLQWQFSWRKCPIALCLAALFIVAVFQLVPWQKGWLSWLSPHTAELYAQLLPSQREVLPSASGGEAIDSSGVGSTISLVPGATQREAIRLLAIFLLFAVVRNNLTSTAQLWRLSVVALANGLLLSLFGVIQLFTCGLHLLYGVYPTAGTTFGPFICKNHFPYYVNMCLGLGIGLLLFNFEGASTSRRRSHHSSEEEGTEGGGHRHHSRHSSRRRSKEPMRYTSADDESDSLFAQIGRVLQRPRTILLGFGLIILAASIVFSASRGGALAMLGGAFACALILVRRSSSFLRLGIGAMVVGFAMLGLLAWFGLERVEERWTELYEETAEAEDLSKVNRLAIWSSNLPSVLDFPLWGTGYGTFAFTELLHRDDPKLDGRLAEYTHNDYLQVLLEAGISGLVVLLLLVGLLLWFGYRAVRRQHHSSAGWLATGLFFGLIAVLIHSFMDFGLHIPAVTFFTTVLCAHLAALGSRSRDSSRHPASTSAHGGSHDEAPLFQGRGLIPVAAAAVMGALALVLVQQGWKAHKAWRYREAAFQLSEGVDRPDRQLQIAYLQAAVHEMPKNPTLCVELARAQMGLYREEAQTEKNKGMGLSVEQGMASLAGGACSPVGFSPAVSCAAFLSAGAEWTRREVDRKLDLPLLMPALATYVRARDNCPIMPEPQTRLAANAEKLARGDSIEAYLERAKFLAPTNSMIWYLCGKQAFQSGQRDEAWKNWRYALELSEMQLPAILEQVRSELSDQELSDKVLPDKPRVLFMAAMSLHPDEASLAKQKPFLERALTALAEQPEAPKLEDQAKDLFLKAKIHDILGQKKEAIAAHQAALIHPPKTKEIDWRLSFTLLLYEEGQLREAERQLLVIQTLQPGNAQAKELLKMVRLEKVKKLK